MTVKESGRSALIIAAGIWTCLAAPLHATEGADNVTPSLSNQVANRAAKAGAPVALKKFAKPRHAKTAQRKSSKTALKSAADKKPAEVEAAVGTDDNTAAIPSSIANANAQLPSADTPTGSAQAMSARANTILLAAANNPAAPQRPADTEVVAEDQLNDLDRALQESKPPATLVVASAEAPAPAPPAPVVAKSDDSSAWDQTSLIGKIFIAFGALLTMASAVRMFMV